VSPKSADAGDSARDSLGSLMAGIDASKIKEISVSPGVTSSQFRNVATDLGVDFRYENGASPAKLMTQAVGGGVGWLDFDNDSFCDLLFVQGGLPLEASRPQNPLDQLYRNIAGRRFQSVTEASGLAESGFSQGVAVGDFDNDGFDDIYVTNVGNDSFHRNLGDGTFEELTETAGLVNPSWGASAAWGDLDNDGDLDLFVCNYTDYDPKKPTKCQGEDGSPGVCHPDNVNPIQNRCFQNIGDGTFLSVLTEAGLDAPGSKSLGVVIADVDVDGRSDIFVANDTTANHLFMNEGGFRFAEHGIQSGCAMNGSGQYQASMGVGFGDFNRDGKADLYCTHFTSDSNTLYAGLGDGAFHDVTPATKLHLPTLSTLGFGTVIADFNCDGRAELFVANGHIDDSFQKQGDDWKMRPQLFSWNGETWHDCSAQAGPYFQEEWLGRGVATADFDNDGDIDLAVSHQEDRSALLENERESGHWLKLRFAGVASNRRGVGVRVVVTQGESSIYRELAGGTSYCAAHEPTLFFGLGEVDVEASVQVTWPSGTVSQLTSVAVDQQILMKEPLRL